MRKQKRTCLSIVFGLVWCILSFHSAEAQETPCLTDANCKGANRCVQNKCTPIGDIFRVPGPQIELQLIVPDESNPKCRGKGLIASKVLDQLFTFLETSKLSVLVRPDLSAQPRGTKAIEQLDLALDAGSRALITINAQCNAIGRQSIVIETTDLVYLRKPSHLSVRLRTRNFGQPNFTKSLKRFVNKLWTIEGAPSGILGSRIAVSCKLKPMVRDIYSLDLEGKNLRRETNFKHITILPSWAPNGEIASTSYVTGNANIHIGDRNFVTKEGLNTGIDFHPRSNRFVFAHSNDDAQNIYLGNSKNGRIVEALTQSKHIETAPAFSPDGKKIVYVSDRSGSPQIYIMNIKTRRVERISKIGSYNASPAWSPDGANLVWNRQINGDRNVIVLKNLHQANEAERVFISGKKSYEHPSFSPDGRSLVSAEVHNRKARIVRIDLRTKKITALAEHELPGICAQASWSPVLD